MLAELNTANSFEAAPTTSRISAALLWKIGLALAVLAALWLVRDPALQFVALIKDRDALARQVHAYGAWGPALLGGLIALQVTVAVLPGHILMLAGGYLYGAVGGFFITWIATVAASQLNYHLARSAGRQVVYRLASERMVERWERLARGKGFMFFLLMFALPIFPSDLMSYVAGFTDISPRRYLAANLLGHLPCAITASLVGAYGLSFTPQAWAAIAAVIAVAALGWRQFGTRLTGLSLRETLGF